MTKRKNPLANLLRERGVSGRMLAKDLGISQSHLCRILSGERRLGVDNAVRISKKYGIPLEAFFQ